MSREPHHKELLPAQGASVSGRTENDSSDHLKPNREWRTKILTSLQQLCFPITVGFTIPVWFFLFPLDVPDWTDIAFEAGNLLGACIGYVFVRRLRVKLLRAFWEVFTYALVLDFLDEFTLEPDFASVILSGTLETSGMLGIALGLYFSQNLLRQQLERSKKAEKAALEAGRLKSEFLANMSHEIRTPMNVIMGMTELTLDTELHSKQRRYLDMVKNSANSLLTIINDILDFSKIEAGKLDLEPIEFNLVETLGEVAKTLRARASQKGLDLSCRIQPSVPEFLVADPTRLRQILVNLVGNAIKFTERGEVRIQVKLNSESESEVGLHFAVSDTGIGIPKEQQQLIFASFAQADGSTTRRFGGTGLGLAISSQLVSLMGGRIWAESDVGEGSTVHFTARAGLVARSRDKPTPPPTLEGLRVMVIDEDADTRNLLSMMLDSWQMQSALVDNRDAALQVMK